MDVRHNNNALKELNDCIGGLLHLGLNVITFRSLLHLGPNVITFRTLLHLGQLLHLGLQHTALFFRNSLTVKKVGGGAKMSLEFSEWTVWLAS